jgi:broad specificity phosphatase PhoE
VAIRAFPDLIPKLLGIDGLRFRLLGNKLMSHALPIVYLARHGETAWSLTGQHTGLTDLPLTERGEENALALRERLSGLNFAKVFTSPLQRARRTCELAGFGAVAEVDPNLVEWDYGQYEGLTTAQIRVKRPDWQLFRDGCPGGESPEQIAARADAVLGRVIPLRADALLFSSGHFLRVLAARWLAIGALDGRYFLLSTASVSELGYENDFSQPVIRLWNDTRHVKASSNAGGSSSKTRLRENSL